MTRLTNTYVYGLGLISSTDSQGTRSFYLHDGLGSITEIRNDAGGHVASYHYDPFGAITSQTGGSSNYWLFAGEQRDAPTGLYYLRNRYYDPASGRFLSRDPVAGQHPYAYVNNNPVNFVDPMGLSPGNGEGGECGWWFLGIPCAPGSHCLQLEGEALRNCISGYQLALVRFYSEVFLPAFDAFLGFATGPCNSACAGAVIGVYGFTWGWALGSWGGIAVGVGSTPAKYYVGSRYGDQGSANAGAAIGGSAVGLGGVGLAGVPGAARLARYIGAVGTTKSIAECALTQL